MLPLGSADRMLAFTDTQNRPRMMTGWLLSLAPCSARD
jgi:hypothetical protein